MPFGARLKTAVEKGIELRVITRRNIVKVNLAGQTQYIQEASVNKSDVNYVKNLCVLLYVRYYNISLKMIAEHMYYAYPNTINLIVK